MKGHRTELEQLPTARAHRLDGVFVAHRRGLNTELACVADEYGTATDQHASDAREKSPSLDTP